MTLLCHRMSRADSLLNLYEFLISKNFAFYAHYIVQSELFRVYGCVCVCGSTNPSS